MRPTQCHLIQITKSEVNKNKNKTLVFTFKPNKTRNPPKINALLEINFDKFKLFQIIEE